MVCGAVFAALLAVVAASPPEDGAASGGGTPGPAAVATAAPAASHADVVTAADHVDDPLAALVESDEAMDGAAFEALERSAGAPAAGDAQLAPAPVGPPLSESGPVLLDRVESPDGWATERLVEPSGEIVEHVVNRAGTVQVCRPVGSLFALRMVEQRPAPNGEYVEVVRDASGALLRFAVGADGEPRAVALIAPPPR